MLLAQLVGTKSTLLNTSRAIPQAASDCSTSVTFWSSFSKVVRTLRPLALIKRFRKLLYAVMPTIPNRFYMNL